MDLGSGRYLAVRGGFDAPLYLGSKATFALGGFGGHATGTIKAGDMLRIGGDRAHAPRLPDDRELPALTSAWEIGVLYGPHGAPDYLTEADIETLFSVEYEVHFNSARTGIRLIGPKPQWARADGGEAGLHPSNIHDNAYAVGAIDFTGDMPIILGPDGPSLGGFVSPAAVAQGELWKLGQLKPGDKVRLRAVSTDEAAQLKRNVPVVFSRAVPQGDALMRFDDKDGIVYRRAGDDNILVEYGPMVLDLSLRLRAHGLMQAIRENKLPGILDLTPGIRSLQVHYDNEIVSEDRLLSALFSLERNLPDPASVAVESRTVHLPLSWNDPQAQLAMRKYQELVRPNAPWCPSNIEFIRRINGLQSDEDVRRIVFDAEYLVLGLGDVYLGAPVATPLDPRHRLVTTKYNPARTWTPENAVGIGGAYLCIYGMEGPGGYQLFGRTIQMWNRWRTTECFEKPWLLRFFDRVRFYPVSSEELLEARDAFPHGRYPLRIEPGRFTLAEHRRYLDANAKEISAFKTTQQQAFETERLRWKELGLDSVCRRCRCAGRRKRRHCPRRDARDLRAGHGYGVEDRGRAGPAGERRPSSGRDRDDEDGDDHSRVPCRHCAGAALPAGARGEGRPDCGPDRRCAMISGPFEIARLRRAYEARSLSPVDVAEETLRRMAAYGDPAVWITRMSEDAVMARARALANAGPEKSLPLYGIPFAVKDNIDCVGLPTTAACPAFAYTPTQNAHVVDKLMAAGAILVGKTNLDQFATGLGWNALTLWRAAQRVRFALHFRRVELGFGRRGRRGIGRVRAGHGYRGLGPRSRIIQQYHRLEADTRNSKHARRRSRLPKPGLRVGVCKYGGQCIGRIELCRRL